MKTSILVIFLFFIQLGLKAQVSDIDGNVYDTVRIGNQLWFAENLKTTKYNDGTPIPFIKKKKWDELMIGAWTYIDNDPRYNELCGKFYNWFAISPVYNKNKNICPIGWHVPSDSEWQILIEFLGGENVAGGKMKQTGTDNWLIPNSQASNSSFFNGIACGHYLGIDTPGSIGLAKEARWWSSTSPYNWQAWCYSINYSDGKIYKLKGEFFNNVWDGNSVRCLSD